MSLNNASLVKPQRLTTVQRNAMAVNANDVGRLIYNADTTQLEYWNGSSWQGVVDQTSSLNGNNLVAPIDAGLITTGTLDGGVF